MPSVLASIRDSVGGIPDDVFQAATGLAGGVGLHGLTRTRFWRGRLYDERYADVNGSFRPTGNLQLGAYLQVGTLLDLAAERTGRRTMLEVWGNANVGRGIALDWDLMRQRMQRDGGTAFTATVLNAGGSWQFDPRQRLRLTLQVATVVWLVGCAGWAVQVLWRL